MKKNKKNRLKIIIGIFILLFLSVTAWFFFAGKRYTYYTTDIVNDREGFQIEKVGEINRMTFMLEEGEEENKFHQEYEIADPDIVQKIISELENIKFKPYYTLDDYSNPINGFYIALGGSGENYLSIIAGQYAEQGEYYVTIGIRHDGVGYRSWKDNISYTTIKEEWGAGLQETLLQILKEKITDIDKEKVIHLSENGCREWTEFAGYYHSEDKERKEQIENTDYANEVMRFEIKDTECYMIVWYLNRIMDDGVAVKRTKTVYKAEIYNQDGVSVDLYQENIADFLDGVYEK